MELTALREPRPDDGFERQSPPGGAVELDSDPPASRAERGDDGHVAS
jgi:hypothetical protein